MAHSQGTLIEVDDDELFKEKEWIGRGKKYDWSNLQAVSHRQRIHPSKYLKIFSVEPTYLHQIYLLPISFHSSYHGCHQDEKAVGTGKLRDDRWKEGLHEPAPGGRGGITNGVTAPDLAGGNGANAAAAAVTVAWQVCNFHFTFTRHYS